MKKLYLLLFAILTICGISEAQSSAKRYILVEHFTNSRCSVCASRNPDLFAVIDDYPDDVHHISYHPPIPYLDCIFYQANPEGNSDRAGYYGVNGTPVAYMLGELPTGSGLLERPALEAELGKASPIEIIVEEVGVVNRTVKYRSEGFV